MRQSLFLVRAFPFLFATIVASFGAGVDGNAQSQTPKLPHRVLLMRHAEKPAKDDDSVHLSPDGNKRADALADIFKTSKMRPNPFPVPDFIFAAKNSKSSARPVETVAVLAEKLKLSVNSKYQTEDYPKLVRDLFSNPKYEGKTILICWRHTKLPQFAKELKAHDAPDVWHDETFDRVWQITYDMDGKATFRNRPQHLLPVDSEK